VRSIIAYRRNISLEKIIDLQREIPYLSFERKQHFIKACEKSRFIDVSTFIIENRSVSKGVFANT
jgi:hypothetical protein